MYLPTPPAKRHVQTLTPRTGECDLPGNRVFSDSSLVSHGPYPKTAWCGGTHPRILEGILRFYNNQSRSSCIDCTRRSPRVRLGSASARQRIGCQCRGQGPLTSACKGSWSLMRAALRIIRYRLKWPHSCWWRKCGGLQHSTFCAFSASKEP